MRQWIDIRGALQRRAPGMALVCLLWSMSGGVARGGATASQWIVVVNGESESSRTIANHYCHWRQIPDRNVIVLQGVPAQNTIRVADFREKILGPILQEIERRNLHGHFQGIAYSADFPTAIDLMGDLMELKERPFFLTPTASINGATYLFRFVMAKSPNVLGLESNSYACRPGEAYFRLAATKEELLAWRKAEELIAAQEFQQAKEQLEKVLSDNPHQFPMMYQAARWMAKAGRTEEALKLLELAIARGWRFRDYLANDEHFASLRQESRFQLLRDSCDALPFDHQPTRGFEARAYWGANGVASPDAQKGISFALSMVLAVVGEGGVTESEALRQLKRAIDADGSEPKGVFYFTKTADVRTTTREPEFARAIGRLRDLGHEAEVVTTDMPVGKKNCLGVMMGSPSFQWRASLSTLVPGAIADNLTSTGGEMIPNNSQTKLTELLLHGAAASSGTVTEPYTIQAKFPHPMIHAHYASGLTAAEAFYLSLTGPYQLLIVGDPLCAPFAPLGRIDATVPKLQSAGAKIQARFTVKLKDQNSGLATQDCLIDGVLVQRSPLGASASVAIPADLASGDHEIVWITTENSPLQRRIETRSPIQVGDEAERVSLTVRLDSKSTVPVLQVRVAGPAGTTLELLHGAEVLGTSLQSVDTFSIKVSQVGRGPVRLKAVAKGKDRSIFSPSVVVEIPTP